MVCGGVPNPVPDHAQRVADMALGMHLVAREVQSPMDGSPIRVSKKSRSRERLSYSVFTITAQYA
jgi:hypothetical protein